MFWRTAGLNFGHFGGNVQLGVNVFKLLAKAQCVQYHTQYIKEGFNIVPFAPITCLV